MPDTQGTIAEFQSPQGVRERCVALPDIPGGVYTRKDRYRLASQAF